MEQTLSDHPVGQLDTPPGKLHRASPVPSTLSRACQRGAAPHLSGTHRAVGRATLQLHPCARSAGPGSIPLCGKVGTMFHAHRPKAWLKMLLFLISMLLLLIQWPHGSTAACLTPDQKAGGSKLPVVICSFVQAAQAARGGCWHQRTRADPQRVGSPCQTTARGPLSPLPSPPLPGPCWRWAGQRSSSQGLGFPANAAPGYHSLCSPSWTAMPMA